MSNIEASNVGSNVGSSNAETPEIDAQNVEVQPPRALSPGALLHGEYEIRRVISRGFTNIYEAQYGDYGAMNPLLIAERDTPQNANMASANSGNVAPLLSSTGTPVELTKNSAEDAENLNAQNAQVQNAETANVTFQQATFSGAFAEDVDTLPLENRDFFAAKSGDMSAVVPVEESDPTGEMSVSSVPSLAAAPAFAVVPLLVEREESAGKSSTRSSSEASANAGENSSQDALAPDAPLQSPLFPPSAPFSQEERDYLVFEFVATTALQDYREPTNDERFLAVLHALSQGLHELSRRNLHADFTTENLRVNADGEPKFYGFATPKTANEADELEQLRSLTAFLLKRVFAESATMRLDDEFGSLVLCEETKTLARRLNDRDDFATIGEAADEIARLSSSTRLRVEAAIESDVGQERELNEDAGFILKMQRRAHLGSHDLELYVVADGMGGHEGGEVASDLTLSSLQRNFEARLATNWNDNIAVRNALIEIIDAVNAEVVALTETPRYRGTRAKPGSTLVFGLRLGARVFVGNVGDSRAYKISNGVLERVSKDHSYVQTLIDRGEISEDEAWDHPEGSVITAHIGFAKLKQRDVFLRLFAPGDKLLLVSDGVVDMLRDRDFAPHIASNDPQTVCDNLVAAANAAGGADNITVVCVQFSR